MQWCELREYKWIEYVTIAVNRNLSNCEKARKKGFRGFNGIRTHGLCVSAAVLYKPELWRPMYWRPANLLSSSTRERNETQNAMMWTAGIQMNWVCDHRRESQFKQLRKSPKKGFRVFNGIRTRGLCVSATVLYQPELWRPMYWRPANLLSLSTRERNETQNAMMWTAGIQMNWVCDHHSESQFKPLRKARKKGFWGINGIRTHGLCVSAAVLYQPELWRPMYWSAALTQRPRVRVPLKPRNPFFRAFSHLLKLRFTAMVTYSIHL